MSAHQTLHTRELVDGPVDDGTAGDGYHDEQRIAPGRGPLDAICLREIDARALRAIGERLFVDVARAMDTEERLA